MSWGELSDLLLTGEALVFQFKAAFLLFLLIPVWVWFANRQNNVSDWETSNQQNKRVFKHSLIGKLNLTNSLPLPASKIKWLLHALRLLLLTLIILTLSNPVKEIPLPAEPQTKTVRDIVFVVESSASMMLPDYELNGQPAKRMAVVKSVLDQFIGSLDGNRFGLVLYAEQAYTLMPITADSYTARLMLKKLQPNLAGRTDEAMGEALGLAIGLTQQQTENSANSTQRRIIVLISDGDNTPSRFKLSEAINYAKGLNLPIYTIGVGAGNHTADRRIYSGLIYRSLKDNSLKNIASNTQGQYFQMGDQTSLKQVLARIDQAEGALLEQSNKPRKQIIYLAPYLTALTLMLFILYFNLVQLFSTRLYK